jgi:hypothetical protein
MSGQTEFILKESAKDFEAVSDDGPVGVLIVQEDAIMRTTVSKRLSHKEA